MMKDATFEELLARIRSCRHCEAHLPLGARPIIHGNTKAKLMIVSQAPGTKAHLAGYSFNDASGDRLRRWLNIDRDTFYNPDKIAIMPMGLCYPGRYIKGGDLPPSAGCNDRWHPAVRPWLKNIQLTLLVGSYAQKYYLGDRIKPTLHETVFCWEKYLPEFFPLPHPSWRTKNWGRSYPWFEEQVLPILREKVQKILEC
jgi:uracil-DNA glycosylase